jgi:hypothetical protein
MMIFLQHLETVSGPAIIQNSDGTVQILQIDSSSTPTFIQLPDGTTAQVAHVESGHQLAGVHTLAEVAAAAADARTSTAEQTTEYTIVDGQSKSFYYRSYQIYHIYPSQISFIQHIAFFSLYYSFSNKQWRSGHVHRLKRWQSHRGARHARRLPAVFRTSKQRSSRSDDGHVHSSCGDVSSGSGSGSSPCPVADADADYAEPAQDSQQGLDHHSGDHQRLHNWRQHEWRNCCSGVNFKLFFNMTSISYGI